MKTATAAAVVRSRRLLADGGLLVACAIWGTAFVYQRTAMEHMGPLSFTGLRWLVGVFAVSVFALLLRRKLPVLNAPDKGALWHGGILCGVSLAFATNLQQVGVQYTTAGNAGFVTGLYVIFVPLIGLFRGRRAPLGTWVGCGVTVIGLYFLSVSADLVINRGDMWVFASAACWAAQILLIETYSRRVDVLDLAIVEFAVCGVLSTILGFSVETVTVAGVWAAGGSLLFAGAISSGVAFTLQVVAQRHSPSAHASVIMSLEGAFAALAGWLMLSEVLGSRAILGCGLMLGGVLLSQLAHARSSEPPLPPT